MADRRRALGLRSGQVAAAHVPGKRAPRTIEERARATLNLLCRSLPTKTLVVKNRAEGHRRADSMCALLGIPFRILGPLLYAAAILVVPKHRDGLGFSTEGFETLVELYNNKPSHKLCLLKKSLSEKSIQRDCRTADEPITRVFFYMYRGQVVPLLKYVPLAAEDLVVFRSLAWKEVEALSKEIVAKLGSAVATYFDEQRAVEPRPRSNVSVDTARQADSGAGPSLIMPTESEQFLSPLKMSVERITGHQQLQTIHSPPLRSPGWSPPLRRVRRSPSTQATRPTLENEEVIVETVEEEETTVEEEKKDDEGITNATTKPSVEQEKEESRQLNFDLRDANGLRPARNPSGKPIEVSEIRQATGMMRCKIIWLAEQWGYNAALLQRDKLTIAELASRVVFYDCGCPKAPKGRMLASWIRELEDARYNNNNDFGAALQNEQNGSRQGTYCSRIEAAHPGYLHELYRKIGRDPKVTYRATFAEQAAAMNELSISDHLQRPVLHLTRHHLKVWFHANRGKVRKGWERPILTKERMKARVEWCKERKAEMAAAEEAGEGNYHRKYYCFLDEKWFYIRSRRKKLKILPRGPHEPEGADDIPMERESSRRHATKVMILGVIADPVEEHNFDGKVYFTRVARNRKLQKTTYSEKVFDDLAANTALQREWHGYVSRNETAHQMIAFLADTIYDIDEEMKQRLIIRYKDHQANGTAKWKEFKRFQVGQTISPQPNGVRRPLDIRDLVLQARFKAQEEVPEDVSCDSEFMKEHMDSIGRAIRAKYHWVPEEDEIFLVMDNAGGHGTRDTIDKYVADLLADHKVRVLWQEPRGPELNLLDLGAWMSLQSAVEKHFRGNRNDVEVLARKIAEVWSSYDASVFRKIWDRWKLALDLIIADEGNNRLVNEHRGSLFTAAAPPPEEEQQALPEPAEDYDLNADDDDDNDGNNDALFAVI